MTEKEFFVIGKDHPKVEVEVPVKKEANVAAAKVAYHNIKVRGG